MLFFHAILQSHNNKGAAMAQTVLHIKMDKQLKRHFKNKCAELGMNKYTDAIRELLTAFSEDRITIIPNKAQKRQQQLYKEKSHDN